MSPSILEAFISVWKDPDFPGEHALSGGGALTFARGGEFGLDEVPYGRTDDGLMVTGDVVLRHRTFVLNLLLGKEVDGVGLL